MKTVEEINELAYKRYGCDPYKFGGQRDGFKEGFKLAQEMQLMQTAVVGQSEQLFCQGCHEWKGIEDVPEDYNCSDCRGDAK